MLLPDEDLISPLMQDKIGMLGVWEDIAKIWGEFGKLYKTLSRVWIGIGFTLVLFLLHLVFSHLLIGA